MGQKLDAQIHSGEEEEPVRSGEKEIQEAGEKSATCNSFSTYLCGSGVPTHHSDRTRPQHLTG